MESWAYAARYCEENVWHLSQHPRLVGHDRRVVFVSNQRRACPMWQQRTSADPGEPVWWDYHVMMMARSTSAGWEAWDLDSRLPLPCPALAWLAATFPVDATVVPTLRPRFRVVDAEDFRNTFASDRSHMPAAAGVRPPPWPAIRTAQETMNLMRFVDVERPFVGTVLTLDGMAELFRPG